LPFPAARSAPVNKPVNATQITVRKRGGFAALVIDGIILVFDGGA
jgi:hypothetical protein